MHFRHPSKFYVGYRMLEIIVSWVEAKEVYFLQAGHDCWVSRFPVREKKIHLTIKWMKCANWKSCVLTGIILTYNSKFVFWWQVMIITHNLIQMLWTINFKQQTSNSIIASCHQYIYEIQHADNHMYWKYRSEQDIFHWFAGGVEIFQQG